MKDYTNKKKTDFVMIIMENGENPLSDGVTDIDHTYGVIIKKKGIAKSYVSSAEK